ncbi:hypothetical protein B566_EDAN019199 [Ephemera danica]|nr:hypothetical protein B566_EDAN019199 [Ephemera danica]
MRKGGLSLVLSRPVLPGYQVEDLLAVGQEDPDFPSVIVFSDRPTAEEATRVLAQGAKDYWAEPLTFEKIQAALPGKALSPPLPSSTLGGRKPTASQPGALPDIVGKHPAVLRVLALARQVAKSRATVLISGASGTGKEVFSQEGAEAAIAKAKALAATIVQKAKAGEDFAELARKHSEDPNTAPEGGDYGWLNKGEMPLPTVEEAALALRKNEISEPLRSDAPALATALLTAPAGQWLPSAYDTPEGAVIARVSSISPPAVDEWEKGKARFVPAYTQAKQEEIADAYMNNLLGKAKVEVNQKSLNSLFPGSGS